MTEATFLASIIANPADDVPRLIYADWLDERGDAGSAARAEFIRVQCRLPIVTASLPPSHHFINGQVRVCLSRKCEPCRLRRHEKNLLKHWDCQWRSREFYQVIAAREVREALATGRTLQCDPLSPARTCVYHRGFIESVTVSLQDWLTHGPALLEAVPTIRKVRLSDKRPNRLRGGYFYWGIEATYRTLDIPEELRMGGLPDRLYFSLDPKHEIHQSEEAAYRALSQACLALARQREREVEKQFS